MSRYHTRPPGHHNRQSKLIADDPILASDRYRLMDAEIGSARLLERLQKYYKARGIRI